MIGKLPFGKVMRKSFWIAALLLILNISSVQQLMAASPWQWEMSLHEAQSGPGMYLPSAIYIDARLERYYVVDSGRNRILTYDKAGKIYRDFSAGNQLVIPYDIVHEEGILWLVEKGKNSLTKIDLEAKKIFPKIITDQGKQIYPDRLEIAGATLFLLDKASGMIFGLDRELNIVRKFTCNDCESGFVDFKVRNGSLWGLEQQGKKVFKFSMNSDLQQVIQLHEESLDFPRSLEIDESGFLYILDRHKGAIAVFDGGGAFRYSFLQPGQARGQVYYPIELKFDPWGRLCVVDEGNGRVQIFSKR